MIDFLYAGDINNDLAHLLRVSSCWIAADISIRKDYSEI